MDRTTAERFADVYKILESAVDESADNKTVDKIVAFVKAETVFLEAHSNARGDEALKQMGAAATLGWMLALVAGGTIRRLLAPADPVAFLQQDAETTAFADLAARFEAQG